MHKKCSKCELFKPLSEFRFLSHRGYHLAECKECERLRRRRSVRPTKRELVVREVAILCKMFGTDIVVDAIKMLEDGKV